MTPNLIRKNDISKSTVEKSKTQLLAEVHQESIWLANFISRHTKKTYLYAVREFIAFHEIAGVKRPQINAREVKAPVLTRSQVRKMIDMPDPGTLKGPTET